MKSPGPEQPFRVIVAGSRSFSNYSLLSLVCSQKLFEWLERFPAGVEVDVAVISGTARGADKLGERWAAENGYGLLLYPADWDRWGKSAGPIRNAEMVAVADAAILFWDGSSRGTANCLELCQTKGIPIHVERF